jgi:hypothetical protein
MPSDHYHERATALHSAIPTHFHPHTPCHLHCVPTPSQRATLTTLLTDTGIRCDGVQTALVAMGSSRGAAGAAVGGGRRLGQTLDDETARDALTFVLSPEGSFFRDFLLDEIVKGLDAISRDQV